MRRQKAVSSTSVNPSVLNRVLLFLGAVGMFVAGTLSFTHLTGRTIPCGGTSACDVLARLPESKWFGQPVALYGLLVYVVLFALAAARPFLAEGLRAKSISVGLVISGVGALLSFGLMNVLLIQLKLNCVWCMASAVTMILTFLAYGVLSSSKSREWKLDTLDNVLIGAFFVLAIGGTGMLGNSMAPNEVRMVTTETFGGIEGLVPNEEYFAGPKNATVTLIEFADFYCPACRSSSARLKELKEAYPRSLRVAYRHLPLYGKEGHEMSLPAAVASEIAAEHGKYWEFVDRIFSPEYEKVDDANKFIDLLVELGVDREVARKGFSGPEQPPFEAVVASVEAAQKIGITSTPSFVVIVNGLPPMIANANTLNEVMGRASVRAALEAGP